MGREVLALAGKDMRLLLRDKGGAFVTFIVPFAYCVFFGVILATQIGRTQEMRIVVVDEDQTPRSAEFADRLARAEAFAVTHAARADAIDAVRRGNSVAYVVLTKGFGERLSQARLHDRPRIEVGVDPARKVEAAMIEGMLTKYAIESRAESLVVRNTDREIRERPLRDWKPIEFVLAKVVGGQESPKSGFHVSFPLGIIWGVLGCCSSFGSSLVIERTRGTLSRLRMAPIGRTSILAGKALACFISTFSLAVALFVVAWLFFGVVPNAIGHLAISLVLVAVAFVGIMMFISILGKTERSVSGLGWGVLLAMAMLGGGMVPRMFMPAWMQSLSNISPVKWAILSMEGAVWRDFSTSEMLLPWGVLLGVGIVFFAIGAKGFSWQTEGS
jgi:linearmycin/streptolysin S transport system permease protein